MLIDVNGQLNTASNHFKVYEVSSSRLPNFLQVPQHKNRKMYKIWDRAKAITDAGLIIYEPEQLPNIDKLVLIGDLLKFQGDERLCVTPIYSRNVTSSRLSYGKEKLYSI